MLGELLPAGFADTSASMFLFLQDILRNHDQS